MDKKTIKLATDIAIARQNQIIVEAEQTKELLEKIYEGIL